MIQHTPSYKPPFVVFTLQLWNRLNKWDTRCIKAILRRRIMISYYCGGVILDCATPDASRKHLFDGRKTSIHAISLMLDWRVTICNHLKLTETNDSTCIPTTLINTFWFPKWLNSRSQELAPIQCTPALTGQSYEFTDPSWTRLNWNMLIYLSFTHRLNLNMSWSKYTQRLVQVRLCLPRTILPIPVLLCSLIEQLFRFSTGFTLYHFTQFLFYFYLFFSRYF